MKPHIVQFMVGYTINRLKAAQDFVFALGSGIKQRQALFDGKLIAAGGRGG